MPSTPGIRSHSDSDDDDDDEYVPPTGERECFNLLVMSEDS
jgi:hypothetical protein